MAEQLIANGFRNVVLMGDHGGGQRELEDVAKKLDTKYCCRESGCLLRDVYSKAGAEFNKWLTAHDLPVGSHASIKDTSELWQRGGDRGLIARTRF